LNLDDRTVQIQLSSGSLNITVRRLGSDDVFEVDTPNQAFSIYQPGRYRAEASEDGYSTVISVREGGGESTGNGQTYTLAAGQRATFSGTDSLNAEIVDIRDPDDFDNWAYGRDHQHDHSRSAQYISPEVVGYEDLDDHGEWRDDPDNGHVWYPTEVSADWAPYREGHWDWVSPWGWTWVDDDSWGYAPFHYGRWVSVDGRWGWVAGPVDVTPVYAPALVVFIGGGFGGGGNVGWFPLGPREVYVPSYTVSREYMTRVNISNTTVTNISVVNIYNTTIVNNSTTIANVNYANRTVRGGITAVPQQAFASAQPVGKAAITVNAQMASAPVSSRASVAPSRESVLGAKAGSAGHVAAPPPAVANRQVVAKASPPPPPVSFARQQQALAAHPGQPLGRQEARTMSSANTATAHPVVKIAPPGKPTQPRMGAGANQPGANPSQPYNRPEPNRPSEPPARSDRPPSATPNNHNEPNRSSEPPAGTERPQQHTPPPAKAEPAPRQQPHAQPQTPEDKKRQQQEDSKHKEKPAPPA